MESRLESVQITMTKAELADFARSVAEEVLARLDAAERLHSNEPVIATGTLMVNLPGHEAELPASVVVHPTLLVGQEFARRPTIFIVSYHHGGHSGTSSKNRKTYRRFLGTIFSRGFRPPHEAGRQGVATEQSAQKRKNAKKSFVFFWSHPRFSCQNRWFLGAYVWKWFIL